MKTYTISLFNLGKALFNLGYICHCFLWSFSNVQVIRTMLLLS